jgi:hypothetical protein
MCSSTNVKKNSVNPVHYIRMLVRPDKLIICVDYSCTPGILCSIYTCMEF